MGRRRQYEDSMYEHDDFTEEDEVMEEKYIFSKRYDPLFGVGLIALPLILSSIFSIDDKDGYKRSQELLFGFSIAIPIIMGFMLLKIGKSFTGYYTLFSANRTLQTIFKVILALCFSAFLSILIFDSINHSRAKKIINENIGKFEQEEKKSSQNINSMIAELQRQKGILKPLVDEYCSPQQRNLDAFRKLLSEARDTATFQAMSNNIEYAIKSWVSCVKDIERSKGFDYQALEAKINSAKDAHNEKFSYLKKDEIKNSALGLTSKK